MNKKLKILYTIPNFDTAGSGKVVYDLVKGLDKQKFAPEILVMHTRGAFFKEVEKLGVPIHVFDYETSYYPLWSFPFRLWKVVKFFKSLEVDIIHSWHWSSDFSEALAARLAGVRYVYTKKNMSWGNKAWIWKSKLSTHVITINTAMKDLYFKEFTNTTYIPVGIDTSYFSPRVKTNKVEEIDLEDKKVIISVANMVPVKGIEVLIEAFIELEKITSQKIELLLVGSCSGNYGEKLKQLANNKKNIHFLGKKMDVRPYLAEADAFVIPTLDEGRKEAQGVAPLEAMSMGIPVLASDLDGLRDVMKNFRDQLFEAGNSIELTNQLNKILNKENLDTKEYLGVLSIFTLEKMIYSHEVLYSKMLKKIFNENI